MFTDRLVAALRSPMGTGKAVMAAHRSLGVGKAEAEVVAGIPASSLCCTPLGGSHKSGQCILANAAHASWPMGFVDRSARICANAILANAPSMAPETSKEWRTSERNAKGTYVQLKWL